jgi:hypothetical protein
MSDVETIETPAYEIARKFCHGNEAAAEAIRDLVREERLRCVKIVATKFEEARDTEFDLGFETARKVFAAAILNPNN